MNAVFLRVTLPLAALNPRRVQAALQPVLAARLATGTAPWRRRA